MTKLFLLAGAAALIGATPALAKPGGGHGNPHATGHVSKAKAVRGMRISTRDQILARKYGGHLCPPGLWKKTPSCMPPGQAKRAFREGQRLTRNYRYYTPYGDIPLSLRDRYDLSNQNRYIYRDNVIYVVDPTTRLVSDIINAVL